MLLLIQRNIIVLQNVNEFVSCLVKFAISSIVNQKQF
jgi:hypothetical protein